MAMDPTDKQLMNGAILVVICGLIAYYMPTYGVQEQQKREEDRRNDLKMIAQGGKDGAGYEMFYAQIHPAVYGGLQSGGAPSASPGTPLAITKSEYVKSNQDTDRRIEAKEAMSRMGFPDWTNIPPGTLQSGVYFAKQYDQRREMLKNMWRLAGVENLDDEIGFQNYTGIIHDEENLAKEMLRELFIAEKIITLCVEAKQREEEHEKGNGLQSEAYMKIISVKPQESIPSGPSALTRNLNYNPDEHNPTSDKFRKYKVKQWRNFIQEYPVEIVFQCDVNTFERFLHSVGDQGQFLVIRTLEIISPFMEETKADKSEFNSMFKLDGEDNAKKLVVKDEHIIVKMSAAGMDFFDPEKTTSLYVPKGIKKEAPTGRVRRAAAH